MDKNNRKKTNWPIVLLSYNQQYDNVAWDLKHYLLIVLWKYNLRLLLLLERATAIEVNW